ncbi:hypothetical protein BJV82DRAFT_118670 [Fennellomyces sp. T-0311]|nr:hypothetical protein BJV82DRAFT_118670 [Fennellomyces sp. T-0311]
MQVKKKAPSLLLLNLKLSPTTCFVSFKRMKKVKCDFVHPVCGRCRGAKASCSYTGAPTQIDLFNLVQLNETITQLQARVAAVESGMERVHDDTQFIAKEIRNKKKKRTLSQQDGTPTVQQQHNKPNWTLSLTPTGLRIDTNIISLNDLYDILLSGLSQLRTMTASASSAPQPLSNKDEKSEQDEEVDGLNAVVIKHNPLYKSKDIIFPLYSAWESGNNHNSNNELNATTTAAAATTTTTTRTCIATRLPQPELLDELLKIYEQCFLCLPLPEIDQFKQQCKAQTISPLLINAVLSWSARHAAIYHGTLGQQDPNKVGEPYFAAAKDLLRDAFLVPRVETVHALLLMYIYSIGKTGPDRCESEAYTFLGLATRMALDLGLHRTQEETGRRLFAALEFLETLCSAHSDKPMLFPQAQTIELLEHEQGERRYRTEFTMHRHKINQIYRRIHTSCHQSDPLFKTVSNLERELKAWYDQLPWYFQYRTQPSWTSTSFREQACLKLNFEYHFQMCQLYSIFLPPHPDNQNTVNLLSLRLCLDSADAITDLLECWTQLQQPWCHFTLDTIVMACLVYGHQLKSNKPGVLAHAKRQMQRIATLLESSPVKSHKYVRTLIARIERQTDPLLSTGDEETSTSSSSIWQDQPTVQASPPPPPPMAVPSAPSASLDEDWAWLKPTELAVNDLFRFADFIYTPTMDMMGYQWPPL